MTSKEVVALLTRSELSLLDSTMRSSMEKLSEMIADDFAEVGASGGVYVKQQVLSALSQERLHSIINTDKDPA